MLIIIDAYNYMKITSGDKRISERAEREFLDQFQKYIRNRGNRLMVVFDAGPSLYKGHDQIGGVHIVYSGQMHSADDVIIEYVQAHAGEDILVVSSDREIRDAAKSCDIVSISSSDFHKIFTRVLEQYEDRELKISRDAVKTTEESDSDLDRLMELGSRNISSYDKNEVPFIPRYVKNNKKASKVDKWAMRKINKI